MVVSKPENNVVAAVAAAAAAAAAGFEFAADGVVLAVFVVAVPASTPARTDLAFAVAFQFVVGIDLVPVPVPVPATVAVAHHKLAVEAKKAVGEVHDFAATELESLHPSDTSAAAVVAGVQHVAAVVVGAQLVVAAAAAAASASAVATASPAAYSLVAPESKLLMAEHTAAAPTSAVRSLRFRRIPGPSHRHSPDILHIAAIAAA